MSQATILRRKISDLQDKRLTLQVVLMDRLLARNQEAIAAVTARIERCDRELELAQTA